MLNNNLYTKQNYPKFHSSPQKSEFGFVGIFWMIG